MELITNFTLLNKSTLEGTPERMNINETYKEVISMESDSSGLNYSFDPFLGITNATLIVDYEVQQTSISLSQFVPPALLSLVMILHFTITPILCTLGIVGNSLCLAVFLHERMRGLSSTVYLVVILFAEVVYLLTLFHEWLTDFRQLVDTYQMGGWCQFITMVNNTSTFVAQWCVLALVVDRYISTCWPEWEPRYCSPVKANIICGSIIIVAVIVYLNLSMIHGEYQMGMQHYCMPLLQYKLTHQTLSTVETFINSLVLYMVVTSLTCLTMAQCLRQRARACHPVRLTARSASAMVKHAAQSHGGTESQQGIFCIFMVIYLMFTLPAQCTYIYNAIHNLQNPASGPYNVRNVYFMRVFLYLQYSRVLFNFPLFACGYPKFRYQLKLMLRHLISCVKCCHGNKHEKDTKIPLAENSGQIQQYLSVIHRDCESEH